MDRRPLIKKIESALDGRLICFLCSRAIVLISVRSLLPVPLFLVLLGCGDESPVAPTAPPRSLQSLEISGTTTFQGDLGETSQLEAIASYSDNSSENVTERSIWQTSDAAVVRVSGSGLLTTVGLGGCRSERPVPGVDWSDGRRRKTSHATVDGHADGLRRGHGHE